ncbi:MAG: hypothetical protein IJW40_10940 [Clostridia bacterium]|nr:hypothetical protein [Clostridia bacterium]
MKKSTRIWLLCRTVCCLLLLPTLLCCATAPPQSMDEDRTSGEDGNGDQGHGYQPEISVSEIVEPLEFPLYEDSVVFPRSSYIKNMPGLLLVANQAYEQSLYCINKSTATQHIFCFDKNCTHEACAAHFFYAPEKLIYSPYNGNIYGCTGFRADSNYTLLYCIDPNNLNIRCIWWGDEMEILNDKAISGSYLYFATADSASSINIYRLHMDDETIEPMCPPEGKSFHSFMISDNTLLIRFRGDSEYYRTDRDFSTYIPTGVKNITYLNGEEYILRVEREASREERVVAAETTCAYILGNLATGEEREVFRSDLLMQTLGFDGEYIYYNLIKPWQYQYIADSTIYRVSIRTGEEEKLCRYSDGIIKQVVCHEGTIYYYKEGFEDYKKSLIYGSLVKVNGIYLAKDFEVIYPQSVIDRANTKKPSIP